MSVAGCFPVPVVTVGDLPAPVVAEFPVPVVAAIFVFVPCWTLCLTMSELS